MAALLATGAVLAGTATAVDASGTSPHHAAVSVHEAAATSSKRGMAGAQAYYRKWLQNPKGLQLGARLSRRPPAGKFVVRVDAPLPVVQVKAAAEAAAAKVLKWKYKLITVQPTPAAVQAGFESALALHPNAIIFAGTPASQLTKQIQQAHQQGVTLISDNTTDPPLPDVIGNMNGPLQESIFAKELAAYFVVNSKGRGHAALFNYPEYPIIGVMVRTFKDAVAQWCPKCQTTVINQQASDIGTVTPQTAVSTVERDPSIKYVFFAGDFDQGVAAALKSAGLSGVQVGSAGEERPAGLTTANAISAYSVSTLGWAVMDALARHFAGDSVAPALTWVTPTQIVTKSNLSKLVLGPHGYYVGVRNYQQEFKRLWRISR